MKKLLKNPREKLRNIGLGVAEYSAKAASVPGAVFAAGSEGGLANKVKEGYSQIPSTFADAYNVVSKIIEYRGDTLDDEMSKSDFANKWSGYFVDLAQNATGEFGEYLQNLAEDPSGSALAALITGITLYGGGKVAKFIRQRGQGGWLEKGERNLGQKIWGLEDEAKK